MQLLTNRMKHSRTNKNPFLSMLLAIAILTSASFALADDCLDIEKAEQEICEEKGEAQCPRAREAYQSCKIHESEQAEKDSSSKE